MMTIDKELISNFNSEQHRMIVNILFTSKWLGVQIDEVIRKKGVTHVQYNVLRILLGSSPNSLTVGDLKRRLINKKADVTRILDRLVEKGFILREVCTENRRQVNITISKAGACLMEDISPLIKVKLSDYFEQIVPVKDAKKVNDVLDLLRIQD